MKTICRAILLCYMFVFILGNFSYAFAEELDQESFTDMYEEVSLIKYNISDEYTKIVYKTIHENGYKYTLSTKLDLLIDITSIMSIVFISTLYGSVLAFGEKGYDLSLLWGGLSGGVAIYLLFSRKTSPNEYIKKHKKIHNGIEDTGFKLPFEKETFIYQVLYYSLFSALSGIYVGALTSYLVDKQNADIYIEKGLTYGFYTGIVLGLLSVKNLDKMFAEKESRLQLYPNIMIVDKNKPVMTMNLAWRF